MPPAGYAKATPFPQKFIFAEFRMNAASSGI
jgi:hypothetical protein